MKTLSIRLTVVVCLLGLAAATAHAETPDIVLHVAGATAHGNWSLVDDPTAASGKRMANADRKAAKIAAPLAAPADFIEMPFEARAGVGYRLWIRGQGAGNSWASDSAYVQFSDSVNAAGAAALRIGSASALVYSLEDGVNAGIDGWGWNDDVYGAAPGTLVYFAESGPHVIRIQAREDGLSIDQVVLSASTYLSAAPGAQKRDGVILEETHFGTTAAAGGDVILRAADATAFGNWAVVADAGASGGARLANANKGAAKLTAALAAPADYFELSFPAAAGVGYRLWMRGKAASDSYANDSAFVQFSDSVTAAGAPAFRIGTTAATIYTVEDCNGCGVQGWGWNDNYYGTVVGDLIYFATTGLHTIRVQIREDGLSLDRIVLSPATYLAAAPGAAKNDTVTLGGPATGGQLPGSGGVVTPPSNLPPVIATGNAGLRIGGRAGSLAAPATLLMTAAATGPEATDTLTYRWDFGDGSQATYAQSTEQSRQNAVHTYTAAGSYTVTLTVSDQAGNQTTRTAPVVIEPAAPIAGTPLKVLQMNTYKGRSTDTRTEQSKVWLQARWMAAAKPDVILLQEVMGSTMAKKIQAELEAATGETWNYLHKTDAGGDSKSAQGVAIFSRLPILTTHVHAYAPCNGIEIVQRAAVAITVPVGGRNVAVIDTHLSSYSGNAEMACRQRQAAELMAWAENIAAIRIVTGDLNADPEEPAIRSLLTQYVDTWANGVASNRAVAYPDNRGGSLRTRSERIDYVLMSKGAPIDLTAVQVPDTRDFTNPGSIASQGKTSYAPMNAAPRASDHEMIIATFDVR